MFRSLCAVSKHKFSKSPFELLYILIVIIVTPISNASRGVATFWGALVQDSFGGPYLPGGLGDMEYPPGETGGPGVLPHKILKIMVENSEF